MHDVHAKNAATNFCSTATAIRLLLTCTTPARKQSCVRAGTARFRPLSVRSLLPEDAELPCASTPAADLTALNAKLWSMQVSCTILPDCR
jgi:hypothetical protein